MKTKSKKIQEILFGRSTITGGTPVVAMLTYPELNGPNKEIKWKGNDGLMRFLIERIEKLEQKVVDLESKKK